MSNDCGIRGRMPRYRFGRYGPQSNDELLKVNCPSEVIVHGSIKAQNMNRISGNIASYSQRCLSKSRAARVARDKR